MAKSLEERAREIAELLQIDFKEALSLVSKYAGLTKTYAAAPVPEAPYAGAPSATVPPQAPPAIVAPPTSPPAPGIQYIPPGGGGPSAVMEIPPDTGGAGGGAPTGGLTPADQALLESVLASVQNVLYQTIDTTGQQPQGSPGQAVIVLWTGRRIRLPFSVNGKSGTFVLAPALSPVQGVVPTSVGSVNIPGGLPSNISAVGGTPVSGSLPTDIGVAGTYAKDLNLTGLRGQLPTSLVSGHLAIDISTQALPQIVTDFQTSNTYAKDSTLTGGSQITKVKPLATLIEDEAIAPTAVAENTAETVLLAGVVTLALGQQLFGNLSCAGPLPVGAATLTVTYIALKGATSGKYYAIAYVAQNAPVDIVMTQTEKLNLVARNSSAVSGANVSGHWQAMAP